MRKVAFELVVLALLLLFASSVFSQSTDAQVRVVGVVTAADATSNQITIKTETGEIRTVSVGSSTALLRLPAGEKSAEKAVKIAIADIGIGDRLFARGTVGDEGKSLNAQQVVVTGAAVAGGNAPEEQRQRDDFRQRGLMGRVLVVTPDKKEISVQSRSREGSGPITVVATDATRIFRYAPDSLNINHASRSSISELRVGDQLRALGERSSDGTRFTAEEIIAGTITRTGGQVVSVNPEKNELKLKDRQGETVTVTIGSRSSLRRVTPEIAATFATRQGRSGSGRREEGATDGRPRERRNREPGANGQGRGPRGGRGFQGMLENLPAITVNELKKGDSVFVTGSEGADPSHLTAIMLVTGDAALMERFIQPGRNRGPQNPGLPGDVMGGGVGSAERPTQP